MATRRMVSREIAESDRFVDMKTSSKLLYFYLVLNADDDGFVGNVKMINFLTGANSDNYDELLKNNLIMKPSESKVYVITDWYTQNKIDSKIYKPTVYLSVRALLFIKSDFSYTTNSQEAEIISPADYWIKNGRDKKTPPETQSQRYLKHVQESSKKLPGSVEESSEKFPAQNRLDKNRLDKSRLEQSSSAQHRAAKTNIGVYTATTSSNGGMGEISSLPAVSTSAMDNNATRDNGVITGEDSGVTTSSNETEINYLFDYLNGLFDGDNIPSDNERLNKLFDTLLDKYRPEFIQQALEQLANTLGTKYPIANVQQALIDHLDDTIKQVMAAQGEE